MAFMNIILGIAITIAFGALLFLIIISYVNLKKYRKAGKLVLNYVNRYNGARRKGNLTKKQPVGKNKELFRIQYLSKVKEFGDDEEKLVPQETIAHKDFIMEDEEILMIAPRYKEEIERVMLGSEKIKEVIDRTNDLNNLTESENNRYRKFWDLFKKSQGGELTNNEIQKAIELLAQTEEKKEKEKKEKKEK